MNKLQKIVKEEYGLVVGENTAAKLNLKICKVGKTRIKISGRSIKTGKKKTIEVPICKFW